MVIQKQKEVFTSTDVQQYYNSRVMLCMSVCGLQGLLKNESGKMMKFQV